MLGRPAVRAQVGLATLALVVLAPLVVVDLWAPVKHGAGVEFFAVSTDVAIGLLIADVLVASVVFRAFAGHRLGLTDRLQLILLIGFPPLMLGISLIRLLISLANCAPVGARQICASSAAGPNSSIAVLTSGICLLVAQYLIAFLARSGVRTEFRSAA